MIPLEPSRSEFLEKAAAARVLPVSCEIVADSDTPVSAFAKLCGEASVQGPSSKSPSQVPVSL
jgi:hypothetical protein